jgi:uncharacterized protein DUF6412
VPTALLAPLALLLCVLDATGPAPAQPALLVGLLAAAAVLAVAARRALPTAARTGAVAVRARRHALDQGPPPRQHDPDAAGHTRCRAPSEGLATV